MERPRRRARVGRLRAPRPRDADLPRARRPAHAAAAARGSPGRFPQRGRRRRYLAARQAALANYSRGRRDISAREACGAAVTPAWAACFANVRPADAALWTGRDIYRPAA